MENPGEEPEARRPLLGAARQRRVQKGNQARGERRDHEENRDTEGPGGPKREENGNGR